MTPKFPDSLTFLACVWKYPACYPMTPNSEKSSEKNPKLRCFFEIRGFPKPQPSPQKSCKHLAVVLHFEFTLASRSPKMLI